jgi:hypothetical protein
MFAVVENQRAALSQQQPAAGISNRQASSPKS